MTSRIAIIPAREGSKRIKLKNIKIFKKKPLIKITLENLKKSNFFRKIHVSTDSTKIKKIVEKEGVKVDFLRPKYLAKDKISTAKVIDYVIKKYKKIDIHYDEVWLFFVSNPFLNSKHIKEAYKIYNQNKKKFSVMSVSKFNYPINWAMELDKNNFLKPIKFKNKSIKKNKVYCEAGMFCIYQKNFLKNRNLIKFKPYLIPIWKTVDIDDMEDFKLAEKLF